jgi:tRNA (guanine-N7-)-methyltransferase
MTWENQYIQLVRTKPDIIVAERDREDPVRAKATIREHLPRFPKCYVEIGSGSGLHLLKLAEQNPDTLCVGMEIRFKRAFKTGEKAERLGLSNVLVIRTDARCIGDLFQPEEVDAFFVNYPDPWDKRRWLKNRILNESMLATMHTLLRPEGFLRYKTDHQEYFASTVELLEHASWTQRKHSTDLLQSPWSEGNIPTEFEYLFKSQSKPLCIVEATKRPSPAVAVSLG